MRRIEIRDVQFYVDDPTHENHWDRHENETWQPWIFPICDRLLDKDHCYIDFGAWIGGTVLYASRKARHVYAFEPDPVAFELLSGNVACNSDINNVTLINSAIWNETGMVSMRSEMGRLGDSDTSIMLGHFDGTTEVQSVRFADIRKLLFSCVDPKLLALEDCNLIKFDIEGAELAVLEDMSEFIIARKPSLILSLHPHRFDSRLLSRPGPHHDTDLAGYYERIRAVSSLYTYCYNAADMRECEMTSENDDYFLTDREWK